MISIIDAAKYFVYISYKGKRFSLTPLKLQKLLYLAQGWSYVWDGCALFNSDFVAWQYGPVNLEIYNCFKKYGGNEIPFEAGSNLLDNYTAKETIEAIWNGYGNYTASQLVDLTHRQTPWKEASVYGGKITNESIKKYFTTNY